MKFKGLLIIVSSAVLLASCSHRISPEKPVLSQTDFKMDSLPVSEINIPIQVDLKPLYALAEKSVDTLFTSPNYPDDWVQEGCDMRYKYSFRRGPLLMKASGVSLNLGFTGYYKIIGSTRVCVSGTVISPWSPACKCGFSEPERRVNVSFTNTLNVLPDYKIRMLVKRNDPQPLDKCTVCFWGQDITKQVMKGLTEELDGAKQDMEMKYGIVDLKTRFQQVWDMLNKVYPVYGLGWLQLNPQKFRINNLFAKNDSLNIYVGLAAKPVISFEKPDAQNSWVPNLSDIGTHPGFNIFLDAILSYDSLSNILNASLAGQEFYFDKGPVKKVFLVKDCKLFGSNNENLIIRVKFGGTDEGTVYFTGKPVYDKQTRILEVKDIDFDIRSKNALLSSADWLFNKRISSEIGKYSKFNLGSFVDTAKVNINKVLNKEWGKGIRSFGTVDDITLVGVYPTIKNLVIRSNCTGDLSVKLELINFSL